MNNQTLNVFLHIPKCGGSTVRRVILNGYKGKRVLQVYSDKPQMDYYTPATFKAHFESSVPPDTDAVIGHIMYTDVISSIQEFEPKIISLVRDPIDRNISEINYSKASPNLPGYKATKDVDKNNLFEFLKGRGPRNYQSLYLGMEKLGSVENILDSINVYKLENYKTALHDFGVISSVDEEVNIENTSKEKHQHNNSKQQLLSREHLSNTQICALKDLYKEEHQLYECAA